MNPSRLFQHVTLAAASMLPITAAETESSFWSRETLIGDWGGVRKDLADQGFTIKLSTTGYHSGLLSGSGDESFEFGGRSDAFIDFNTGKLGLSDSGGFHVHVESRYGSTPRAVIFPMLGSRVCAPASTFNSRYLKSEKHRPL